MKITNYKKEHDTACCNLADFLGQKSKRRLFSKTTIRNASQFWRIINLSELPLSHSTRCKWVSRKLCSNGGSIWDFDLRGLIYKLQVKNLWLNVGGKFTTYRTLLENCTSSQIQIYLIRNFEIFSYGLSIPRFLLTFKGDCWVSILCQKIDGSSQRLFSLLQMTSLYFFSIVHTSTFIFQNPLFQNN